MSAIRTAVLGYGLGGRVFHCPFVSAVPGLELAAITTANPDRQALAHARYPDAHIFDTPEAVFADPSIDLVIVSTPNDTHVALAAQALQANKHVVIDKPFASTSAEARSLISLAAEQNKTLAPFHNRRFDGDFLTLRKLLADQTLGRVAQIISHMDRFRPLQRPNTWKEAAGQQTGLLVDLGPHLCDQALALFGPPARINASVRFDRDHSNIDDAFDITLEYDTTAHFPGQHLTYSCHTTMLAAEAAPRFRVLGTHGAYTKFGVDNQEPTLVGGATPPVIGSPQTWLPEPQTAWGTLTLATERKEPIQLTRSPYPTVPGDYRLFYASVRDAINNIAPLAIPAEAGFHVIRLLELALQSSHERRSIPIDFA